MRNPKQVIVVAGPTASGKSELAMRLATALSTEIINADSRQCYTELGVAVAKPSKIDRRTVPHHFVDVSSYTEHISAADFARYTESLLGELFHHHETIIVSGGTGLYLKAWIEGLSPIPDISTSIRSEVDELYASNGLDALIQILRDTNDPYIGNGEIQNPSRVRRAVEVQLMTGQSILHYQSTSRTPERDYQIRCYALSPPREVLQERIIRRTQQMMQAGLIDQNMPFYPYRHHKNLKTVGYTEVFEGYDKGWSEDHICEQIIIHTRQYAKRQSTWYRNQGSYELIAPESAYEEILNALS